MTFVFPIDDRLHLQAVEAALNAWSLGAPASAVQYVDPADRTVEPVVDAQVVESSLTKSGKVVVAYVEATDRKGLLAATTAALRASLLETRGAANQQLKVPRVLRGDSDVAVMHAYAEGDGYIAPRSPPPQRAGHSGVL